MEEEAAREAQAHDVRVFRELQLCRAKLLAHQKQLAGNNHPGQRKRLKALDGAFRRQSRNVRRDGEWRNTSVRDAHRVMAEGRDIAADKMRLVRAWRGVAWRGDVVYCGATTAMMAMCVRPSAGGRALRTPASVR